LYYPPADTLRDTFGNLISDCDRFALADIDADGKLDLFVGRYAGYIRYYHNVGTTTNPAFQLVSDTWFNIYSSEGSLDPCFGDLDGDGDLDLLIGTGQGHVMYYRNDGTPQTPQMTLVTNNYLTIAVQKFASPELADIDGDGDLDLFIGRSSSEDQNPAQGDLFFYRNDGTSHNPIYRFITSNYLGWDCGYVSEPRLVDVDGDGTPDLLSPLGSHLIYYHNTGTLGNPIFSYQSSNYGGINVFDLDPWFVDINGDGLIDIITGTSAIPGPPGLKLFLNQGTPQEPNWVLDSSNLLPGVFNTYSVHLSCWTGDIDNDTDQDLFVTDDNGYLYLFRNIGTPTNFQFQYVTNNWQNLSIAELPVYRFGCLYDIDYDGDLDLFINRDNYYWYPFDKNLLFYRNHGSPQNANMVLESNDLFPDQMIWQSAPYVIDIDQDGDGDLFVGDSWGGIRFFRNITNEGVNPNPKYYPLPQRQISILPNPGNSGTTISYVLAHPQHVNLSVYNLLGSRLATLVDGLQQPGEHISSWDAKDRASGIYLVRFTSPELTTTQKVVIVK
jgi:large repetitive protein